MLSGGTPNATRNCLSEARFAAPLLPGTLDATTDAPLSCKARRLEGAKGLLAIERRQNAGAAVLAVDGEFAWGKPMPCKGGLIPALATLPHKRRSIVEKYEQGTPSMIV